MGSVKIDVHKAEYQFHRVSLSDIDCIKGLIRFRHEIDTYQGIEINRKENEAGDCSSFNAELIVTYLDLDNLIERAKFKKKQLLILDLFFEGRSAREISKTLRQSESSVNDSLGVIAEKIKKLNDLDWKYEYAGMSLVKSPWEYKRCTKCKEWRPATSDFFNANKGGKGGLRSICKVC